MELELAKLTIRTDNAAFEAAHASLKSVATALEHIAGDVFDGLREDFLRLFVLSDERSDLVVCEPVGFSAARTGELQGLKVAPSERYNELVAAIAARGDGYRIRVVHGWPILSVDDRKPTVAEAGAATNRPG